MIKSKKKISFEKILDYFLAVMLILNCQTVYQNSVGKNYRIFELTFGSIIISSLYKFIRYGMEKKRFFTIVSISLVYYIYLLFFVIFSVESDFFVSFMARYAVFPFVLIYFYSQKSVNDKINIFIYFINISCVICVISSLFWFFGTFLHILSPNSRFEFEWGKNYNVVSYFDIYFEVHWIDWIPGDLKRNTSFFVEGPMFALVIILSEVFYYMFSDLIYRRKLVLFILTIASITTFSITSYAFTFLIYILILFKKKKYRGIIIFFAIPLIMCAMIAVMVLKSDTGSYSLRMGDIGITLKAWIESPIFGHGFGHINDIVEKVSDRGWTGISSSITAILIQGGLSYLLLFLVPILCALKIGMQNKKRVLSLVIASCYLIMLVMILFNTFYINFYIWVLLSCVEFYKRTDEEKTVNIFLGEIYRKDKRKLKFTI